MKTYMDKALLTWMPNTVPSGATGLPTTGRTDGGVSAVAGGANVQGVSSRDTHLQALWCLIVLNVTFILT